MLLQAWATPAPDRLMILPPPCPSITGITARQTRKVPVRLTLMVSTHSAMSLSCRGPMGPEVPALFTSTSMRPNPLHRPPREAFRADLAGHIRSEGHGFAANLRHRGYALLQLLLVAGRQRQLRPLGGRKPGRWPARSRAPPR